MARSARRQPVRPDSGAIRSAVRELVIREVLFVRLTIETAKYLEMKSIPFGEQESSQMKVQRGIIRGMALAMTKMYGNGYEPYWTREIRAAEQAAVRLGREWIDDGKSERDDWWLSRRERFWKSRSDAGQARGTS